LIVQIDDKSKLVGTTNAASLPISWMQHLAPLQMRRFGRKVPSNPIFRLA